MTGRLAVRVAAPASAANLGPGYDSLGLALGLRDQLTVRVVPSRTRIRVRGEGCGDVTLDDHNLVVASIRSTFDLIGFAQPGLEIDATNVIPHGRGLGSSAAAIVSGVGAAMALAEPGSDPDRDAVFAHAAVIEGHPDNVAACVFGGLTIAWTTAAGARAVRLPVAAGVAPLLFVPDGQLRTEVARTLLPAHVDHAAAAANAGRAALLVAVLTGQAPMQHLLVSTDDALHQPFRAAAMPVTAAIVAQLRAAAIPAVVSGAGPSVLAFPAVDSSRPGQPDDADRARSIVGARARARSLRVDVDGLSTRWLDAPD